MTKFWNWKDQTETEDRTLTIGGTIAEDSWFDDEKSELSKTAVFYAVGYLYEHRENTDHHALTMTLRSLLFALREGVFLTTRYILTYC